MLGDVHLVRRKRAEAAMGDRSAMLASRRCGGRRRPIKERQTNYTGKKKYGGWNGCGWDGDGQSGDDGGQMDEGDGKTLASLASSAFRAAKPRPTSTELHLRLQRLSPVRAALWSPAPPHTTTIRRTIKHQSCRFSACTRDQENPRLAHCWVCHHSPIGL